MLGLVCILLIIVEFLHVEVVAPVFTMHESNLQTLYCRLKNTAALLAFACCLGIKDEKKVKTMSTASSICSISAID